MGVKFRGRPLVGGWRSISEAASIFKPARLTSALESREWNFEAGGAPLVEPATSNCATRGCRSVTTTTMSSKVVSYHVTFIMLQDLDGSHSCSINLGLMTTD